MTYDTTLGRTTMRNRATLAGLSMVLLVTGCQSATAAGTREVARVAAPQAVSVPLTAATTPHSKAAATVLADAALDQVAFPTGSSRLPVRPVLGTANLDQLPWITSRAVRTRWWSVPGVVADVAVYLVAHPPAGINVTTQGTLYVWSAAAPLAFDMDAYLVQDGTSVDVSLGAEATWTPAKTAIETIPASVTSATLDYYSPFFNGLYPALGADRRRVVTGAPLAHLRGDINALKTPPNTAAHSCPADFGDQATLTMRYAGRTVVVTVPLTGCMPVAITSDGKQQPWLSGLYFGDGPGSSALISAIMRLVHAPVRGTVARPFRTAIYSAKAADTRANLLLDELTLPAGTAKMATPKGENDFYQDRNNDYLIRSRWLSVPLSRPALLTYLQAHVPAGTVIAHLGTTDTDGPDIVEQLAGVYPSPAAVTLTLGSAGQLELDAAVQWSPSRSPLETIPASTRSALLTIEPYTQGSRLPTRRVEFHGAALAPLIQWLNTRPAKVYTPPCSGGTAKVGATFHLKGRVVTFYTEDPCTTIVVVNGKAAPYLTGSFAAIVERLLKVQA
ncbi:hypothetical protein acdb102_18980 [Acidothermaceae bacterium B102]|nr:hypothetical protein acdb102_18980 [Acidothermaceae bacterium B102]